MLDEYFIYRHEPYSLTVCTLVRYRYDLENQKVTYIHGTVPYSVLIQRTDVCLLIVVEERIPVKCKTCSTLSANTINKEVGSR